jgi:pimeloyl-ACP methyl ester carboxylesterase
MNIRRGYFDGPRGQIHYRTCGAGRPLLLLHQSPISSLQFAAAMPGLAAAGFHALAIDMPGFGMSDPLPEPRTLEDFAAAAAAGLDAMGWKSACVVGHHTGAVVGAVLAEQSPARVDRLVLNGMPLLTEQEKEFFRGFYFGPTVPAADGSHLMRAWETRVKATPGWTDLEAMHRYLVDGLVSGKTSWMAFPLVINADLSGLISRIKVPTLLFTNTGEDLYDATCRCLELRPDFAYFELVGGTHDIVDEQTEAWVAQIVRFLA